MITHIRRAIINSTAGIINHTCIAGAKAMIYTGTLNQTHSDISMAAWWRWWCRRSSITTIITLVIFYISHLNPTCLCCPLHQKEALFDFKQSLVREVEASQYALSLLSSYFDSWNLSSSSSDCCSWELVNCSLSSSYDHQSSTKVPVVTGLHLSQIIQVNGSSSGANKNGIACVSSKVLKPLFNLNTLEYLDISFDYICGDVSALEFRNWTRMNHLDISYNQFQGSIPRELFLQLKHLQYVDMMSNSLEGTLSAAIGNLKELQHLSLPYSSLHGQIPTEIGHLPRLKYLDLSDNGFTGGIPSSFSGLATLEHLDLQNNLLSGTIEGWLFDLKRLKKLKLGGGNRLVMGNNTNSTRQIVPKFQLTDLNLDGCGLSGSIPSWLSNQTQLIYLSLGGNELNGTIPLWLAETNMASMNLSHNNLSGPLPPSLFQSDHLSTLDLSSNHFSGELPNNVGEASGIWVLMLANNSFSGPVPNSIANMTILKVLDLSRNHFSGNRFPDFGPDSPLNYVGLSSNRFTGSIPVGFGESLVMLFLDGNQFSGSLPPNLTNLVGLEFLDLHDNNISGEIPGFISQLSSLLVLNLRNNSIEGSLSSDLFVNLTSLHILDVSDNKLKGSIPPSIGSSLPAMINNSYVVGSIEYTAFVNSFMLVSLMANWKTTMQYLTFSNMAVNCFLDLSSNEFSGDVPSSLGKLNNLKSLNISRNHLTGTIPTSFGELENVEALDLSHNNLSGEIPSTLVNLQYLTMIDLSNNKLTGEIPNGDQMDRLNDPEYYANNSGICGEQIQVPCPGDQTPTPQVDVESSEDGDVEDSWFSWQFTACIGFVVAFVGTVGFSHASGYFSVGPGRRRRGNKGRCDVSLRDILPCCFSRD